MSNWKSKIFGDGWIKIEWNLRGVDCDFKFLSKQLIGDEYDEFDKFTLTPKSYHHNKKAKLYAVIGTDYSVSINYKTGLVSSKGVVSYPMGSKKWDEKIDEVFSLSDVEKRAKQIVNDQKNMLLDLGNSIKKIRSECESDLKIIRDSINTLPKGAAAKEISSSVKNSMNNIIRIGNIKEVLAPLEKTNTQEVKLVTPQLSSPYSFCVEVEASGGYFLGGTGGFGFAKGFPFEEDPKGIINLGIVLGLEVGLSAGLGIGYSIGPTSFISGWGLSIDVDFVAELGAGIIVNFDITPDGVEYSGLLICPLLGGEIQVAGGFGGTATFPPFELP